MKENKMFKSCNIILKKNFVSFILECFIFVKSYLEKKVFFFINNSSDLLWSLIILLFSLIFVSMSWVSPCKKKFPIKDDGKFVSVKSYIPSLDIYGGPLDHLGQEEPDTLPVSYAIMMVVTTKAEQ